MQISRQVPIGEAAAILGISVQAVRRRIRAGTLSAERIARPQGHVYLVTVPDLDLSTGDDVSIDVGTSLVSEGASNQRHVPTGDRLKPTRAPRDAVALALVEDLRQSRARIAQLEQERFELAGRMGYFQSELEQARETIRALQAPVATVEVAPDPSPRPWWRLW